MNNDRVLLTLDELLTTCVVVKTSLVYCRISYGVAISLHSSICRFAKEITYVKLGLCIYFY